MKYQSSTTRSRTLARVAALVCWHGLFSLVGCTKFQILNATVPSCSYALTSNLPYADLPRQKLDVYRPRHLSPDARPGARVVIFFYGGDWQYGEKADYRFVAEALASRGFVTVLPDYRLYPQTAFPGFVQDGAQAVRWVHDHIAAYGGDPSRIYLVGHSAGAHIAALLTLDNHYLKSVGLDSTAIRATAAMSGPYDFLPGDSDRAVFNLQPGAKPDPAIEPIHFANDHSPPMLLIHGCRDDIVRPDEAIKLAAALHQVGGPVSTAFYPNLGHAGIALAFARPFQWLAPVADDVAAFFNAH